MNEMITFEDSEKLRALAQLLKKMLPGGERMSDGEALALAQAARAMGRNPLAGEIYAIPGKGVADGYRGLIKDARPGSYHLKYRPLTAEEVEEHEVRTGDIARACELYLFAEVEQCKRYGVPYEPTVGVGIVREEEKFQTERWDNATRARLPLPRDQWKPIPPPTGRSWGWKAEIRAMKDALRRAGVAYVDLEEIEGLRAQAEEAGIDTRGATNAEQIARLVEQQAYLAAQSAARQEQLDQVEEAFGPDARDEAARAMAEEAADDLFGAEAPRPARFWDIPEAWQERMMTRLQAEVGDYYRHIRHIENTLRKEGFTGVTRANAASALAALIEHARQKGEGEQGEQGETTPETDALWDDVIPETAFQP